MDFHIFIRMPWCKMTIIKWPKGAVRERFPVGKGDGSEDEYTDKEVASADAIHTEKTGA